MKDNIVLTGFSGTGKTAIGKEVARSLGWTYVDTDSDIVEKAGKPIADIFSQDGEARFRDLERQEVRQACAGDRRVISVGGGAIMDDECFTTMKKRCIVVGLEALPETIYRRLAKGGKHRPGRPVRPLLAVEEPLERIRSLKAERQYRYSQVDWTVHTDDLSIGQAAAEVLRGWRAAREVDLQTSRPQPKDIVCVAHTSSASYPLYVGWGLREKVPEILKGLGLEQTAYIFTDDHVVRPHARQIQKVLQAAGLVAHTFVMPSGEATKSLDTAQSIYRWLAEHRAERNHAVLAVGGGMVGDMAGFVAATYLRGLPFVQIPTSLAAMVDASIGGKVAVNLASGKNLVGAFHQPRAVIADVEFLSSLQPRELASGWAEAIKHALILDPALFDLFARKTDGLLALERDTTTQVVRRSVAIKVGVVTEDERETTGRRSLLNYGHTVGHAIEAATEYGAYLHGEAVSVGMMAAAEIGHRMGITPKRVVERQRDLLVRFQLPVTAPGLNPGALEQAISLDKKTTGGAVRWVLLEDIGQTVQRRDVPPTLVREVLEEICSNG
ncbi:MAG: shikimate kinase / 3-dehydroquinate synthase [Chloroflexi bacterium]|nr:MAG: shikimate kinase / 3-dehydroquinate synthase [Chloroflexota bacterium]